ncbi:hypothetical protein TWF506_010051 [Arthrobotrys conoides]
MDFRLHNISPAHPNTCDWFFETERFRKWLHRDDVASFNGVLWIKGKPGAGKSTLMKHTLLHCQKELSDYSIAAYFFNTRGQGLEKSRCGMLRSLLYQLCDSDLDVYHLFLRHFRDKEKKHGKSWQWEESELETMILDSVTSSTKRVVLLVDALDECDEAEVRMVVKFLELLSSVTISSSQSSLNVCLSSRHYPNISMSKKLDLTIERIEAHNKDIAIYIQDKLRIDDDEIKHELRNKAEGLFMWIILVVGMLNRVYDDGDIDAVWTKLREIPSDLDTLFSILLEIKGPEEYQMIFMLEFMLFAQGRLTPVELYYAVKSGTKPESLQQHDAMNPLIDKMVENFIINNSRGLVEICGDQDFYSVEHTGHTYVQFIHKTVEDFLFRNKRLQALHLRTAPDAVAFGHGAVAFSCLNYIKVQALKEFLQEPGPFVRMYRKGCYPFLRYATTNFFYHAEHANGEHQRIIAELLDTPRIFHVLRSVHDIFVHRKGRHPTDHAEKYGEDANLLYVLSFHGYSKLIQTLLVVPPSYKVDVNAQGGCYGTSLNVAVSNQSTDIIRILLDAGADPNISGGPYSRALHTAILRPYTKDEKSSVFSVAMLIDAGADVNANGGVYGTALQAAAGLLVAGLGNHMKFGAKLNMRTEDYESRCRPILFIRILLEAGADVNIQGGRYGNILQAVVAAGAANNYYSIFLKMAVQTLLDAGANVNAQGGEYGSVLQAAAGTSAYRYQSRCTFAGEIIKMLLDAGADVNAEGGKYGSALCAICYNARFAWEWLPVPSSGSTRFNRKRDFAEIVQMLLRAGADVNSQVGNGEYSTPLRLACGSGDSTLVKILLDGGADVSAASEGTNAVDAAFKCGCYHIDRFFAALASRLDHVDGAGKFEASLRTLRMLQLAGATGAAEAEQNLEKYRDWISTKMDEGMRIIPRYDKYLKLVSGS